MAIPNADELINDRIKFKFYSAEKHLANLKELQARREDIGDNTSRVKYEMEIEELLSHLMGVRDALLFRINDKLGLGLAPKDVHFGNVKSKLGSKQHILQNWSNLTDPNMNIRPSWLTILNDIRNQGMHRNIINKRVEVEIREPEGTSTPNRICFAADPDSTLEMVPYLEDRIQKMRDLINGIFQNEPSLASP